MAKIYRLPTLSISTTGLATETKQDSIITELQTISNETANKDVLDLVDSNIIDISSNNIPASSGGYLTIVASLAADIKKIQIVEDIGEFIGLYSDISGSPVLEAILPLGGGEVEVSLPVGSELGLRHMKDVAITTGFFSVNFLG